jgi:hypothetical protein
MDHCDCHCHDDFNYTTPLIVGGLTGDYFVTCPITSCRWAEYSIIAVANIDSSVAKVLISGDSKPPAQLDYTGATTSVLNDDSVATGIAILAPATSTLLVDATAYYRIQHSQKRVFIRIDVGNGKSCYVTLRFRVKPITVIPGPAHTVHPDHQEQLNIARAEKTKERLTKMGIPVEVEYHG